MLSQADVAKHNSRKSCWIIVAGQVYDVTDFVDDHPGGPGVILRYGGKVSLHVEDFFVELMGGCG